jgi:hypothetical protein
MHGNFSSENSALQNFPQSRDRLSGESSERAARLAQTAQQFASSRLRRRSAGEAQAGCPQGNPNAAFSNGIVKNQQRSATEVLHISSSENSALLDFYHMHENFSG